MADVTRTEHVVYDKAKRVYGGTDVRKAITEARHYAKTSNRAVIVVKETTHIQHIVTIKPEGFSNAH